MTDIRDRTPAPPRLHFSLAPEPSRLLRARDRIRDYLHERRVGGRAVDAVVLAIEEAMTNAVRHSGSGEDLEVDLRFDGRDLVAEVRDRGRGFDVDTFDPTVVPDPLLDHGRGLFLIAALMDDLSLRRNGGLEVHMRKAGVSGAREPSPRDASAPDDGHLERVPDPFLARDRSFLEEIPEGFAALDWEYRFTYVNANALALYGLEGDQVIGRTVWDLFPYLGANPLGVALRDAMELGVSAILDYESPYLGRFLEYRVYPTRSGLSFYSRDIDERKRREREHDRLFAALRASEARLRCFYDAGLVGVIYWNTDGEIVDANDRFLEMTGYSREELAAGEIDWIYMTPPEFAARDERSLAELAAVGANSEPFEKEFLRKDGSRVAVIVAGAMLDDERRDGVAFALDVSDRKTVEAERQRLLEESQVQAEELQAQGQELAAQGEELQTQNEELAAQGEELQTQAEELRAQADGLAERSRLSDALNAIDHLVHSSLQPDEIFQRALDEGADALAADRAAIELRSSPAGFRVSYQQGFDLSVTHVFLENGLAPNAMRAEEGREVFAIDDMRDGPQDVGFVWSHRLRSVLAVPLFARDTVIGSLLFYGKAPRHFSREEVDFGRRLGATVALALENARLYDEQRDIAATLQRRLIHALPKITGLDLAGVSRAAYAAELVGGDFDDVFALPDGRVLIAIGDVAGKGVQAAGYTEALRGKIRAFASLDPSPGTVLARTNRLSITLDPDQPHVTVFLALLDPASGELAYASAGHPPALHLTADGPRLLPVAFCPPLGTFECAFREGQAAVATGDALVFYTDGVTEARRSGEMFGEARLLHAASGLRGLSANDLADGLLRAVVAYADRLTDDVDVVAVRRG